MATKMVHGTLVTTSDVNPANDITFPLDFGAKENDMGLTFRFSWENQNVDVHQNSMYKVMNALLKFKTDLMHNTVSYLELPDRRVETHLVDFDILNNKNFDGLVPAFRKPSINPKDYVGSPLLVTFKMYNTSYDVFNLIKKSGHFFIRGGMGR